MKKTEKYNNIINCAKEAFIEKGLFNTSMNDIAQKAGMTRRTLYRYFDTKEDVTYEVAIMFISQWNNLQESVLKELDDSGINMLETFLLEIIDKMLDKRYIIKYLAEFDFYFTDDNPLHPSNEREEKFDSITLVSEHMIKTLITKGIEDTSIRDDLDVDITVATISNVLWGFAQRIVLRESTIIKETGFTGVELIKHQIKLYVSSLK